MIVVKVSGVCKFIEPFPLEFPNAQNKVSDISLIPYFALLKLGSRVLLYPSPIIKPLEEEVNVLVIVHLTTE